MAFKRSNFHIHAWQQSNISNGKGSMVLKRNSKMTRGTDALANGGQVIHFHRPNPLSPTDPMHDAAAAQRMAFADVAGAMPDIYFKAFITAYNETFASDWSEETVLGRSDGLHTFKATSRSISLGFQAPAATESEAFNNLLSLQALIHMLYPSYADGGNAISISQSPLIRVKIMNLLMDSSGRADTEETIQFGSSGRFQGVLAAVKNLTVGYNLETDSGVIEVTEHTLSQMILDGGGPIAPDIDGYSRLTGDRTGGAKKILPKLLDISIELDIIHESFLGWTHTGQYDLLGTDNYGPEVWADPSNMPPAPSTTEFEGGSITVTDVNGAREQIRRLDMGFSLPDDPNVTTRHNANFPYGLGTEPSAYMPAVTVPVTDPDPAILLEREGEPLASNSELGTADEALHQNSAGLIAEINGGMA